MRVASLTLRDFRSYESSSSPIGECLTVVHGPNGVGKSNLLEALYFGCTGRSCRTANEREVVRFGSKTARVVVRTEDEYGLHELAVGLTPGEAKRMTVDGASVERLLDVESRPLVSVFLPDRLELVKGVPSLRRSHLDQLTTALWPSRVANRRLYSQALAQRNALLVRIRAGFATRATVEAWDRQLAHHALALMSDRHEAVEMIRQPFTRVSAQLGLDGIPTVSYKPRSKAGNEPEFVEELSERIDADIDRGFTGHGPHRDDLAISREGRELRTYGSQGQQRLGLLSLLLAERGVISQQRQVVPLMLLDDVMSELDSERRASLVSLLKESGGQALITSTDLDHVPGGDDQDVFRIPVSDHGELPSQLTELNR